MRIFLPLYLFKVIKTIDLPALEAELRQIKGIGDKRLEEIMAVVEKFLDIE